MEDKEAENTQLEQNKNFKRVFFKKEKKKDKNMSDKMAINTYLSIITLLILFLIDFREREEGMGRRKRETLFCCSIMVS